MLKQVFTLASNILITFILLPDAVFTADCALIGIIDPSITEKDITLLTTKNICTERSSLETTTCCNSQHSEKIKNCWKNLKKKGTERTRAIRKLIKTITEPKNIDTLMRYIRPVSTDSRVLETEIINKSKKNNRTWLQILQNQNLTLKEETFRNRILQTTIDVPKIIEEAKRSLTAKLDQNLFTYQIEQAFLEQTSKCWNHYFNIIQKGLICSLCLDDSRTKFYKIKQPDGQLYFNYPSCDDMIPHCFKLISIQTELLDFFRNIIILIYDKLYQGTVMFQYVTEFVKKFPEADKEGLVAACRDQARCEPLCNNTIKFGDFSNIYIIGNIQVFQAIKTIIETLGQEFKESLWTFRKEKIDEKFVSQYLNNSYFLNLSRRDEITSGGCFVEKSEASPSIDCTMALSVGKFIL